MAGKSSRRCAQIARGTGWALATAWLCHIAGCALETAPAPARGWLPVPSIDAPRALSSPPEGAFGARGLGRMTARIPGTQSIVSGVRLKTHHVDVSIVDGLARTEVVEEFHNDSDRVLEGRLTFTLPSDASVSRLALWVEDELVEGEMVARDRAREIFSGIVDDTVRPRDPALLEWVKGNELSLTIFPIPAHASRRVLLAYNQALLVIDGRARYRYPLSFGGDDATTVDDFAIRVVAFDAAGDVRTPTYPAVIRTDPSGAEVSYDALDFVPEEDFEVEMEVGDAPLRASYHFPEEDSELVERSAGADADAYVALSFQALPRDAEPATVLLRDRVIVLDASYSQTRASLELQRYLAMAALGRMQPEERFALLSCDAACEGFPASGLALARDETIERAGEWLAGRTTGGSTNIAGALSAAAARLDRNGAGQIVYFGDGAASSGELREERIASRVSDAMSAVMAELRLFGVGRSVDESLLGTIARRAGGTYQLVTQELAQHADDLVAALEAPVIAEPVLSLPEHMLAAQPTTLPNLVLGQTFVVVAKLAAPIGGEAVLSGSYAGRPYRMSYLIEDAPVETRSNPIVPRLWAEQRIAELTMSNDEAARAESVLLSQRHHVMSRHTSLLVLESERMYREFGVERRQRPIVPTREPRERRGVAGPPDDARARARADALEFGMVGLLGPGSAVDPFDDLAPSLGLSGIGSGGAGRGEDAFRDFGSGSGRLGSIGHGERRALPARVRMGATTVSGRLPPEVIQRIIRQHFGRIRLCYERALESDPRLTGDMAIRFVISRAGSVTSVSESGDLPSDFTSCVTKVFYDVSFPSPDRGSVVVTYPLSFTPSGAEPRGRPRVSSSATWRDASPSTAVAELAAIVELEPSNAEAQHNAARAYEALGDARRACAHQRAAADLMGEDAPPVTCSDG